MVVCADSKYSKTELGGGFVVVDDIPSEYIKSIWFTISEEQRNEVKSFGKRTDRQAINKIKKSIAESDHKVMFLCDGNPVMYLWAQDMDKGDHSKRLIGCLTTQNIQLMKIKFARISRLMFQYFVKTEPQESESWFLLMPKEFIASRRWSEKTASAKLINEINVKGVDAVLYRCDREEVLK